jgi:hypothetical protein
MDRDHTELFLSPFLRLAIAELNRNFSGALDHDRAAGFFAIHIDGEVGGKSLKVLGPASGRFEGSAKEVASLRVVGHCRRFLLWLHQQSPLRKK